MNVAEVVAPCCRWYRAATRGAAAAPRRDRRPRNTEPPVSCRSRRLKVVLGQAGHRASLLVEHGDAEIHEIDARAEGLLRGDAASTRTAVAIEMTASEAPGIPASRTAGAPRNTSWSQPSAGLQLRARTPCSPSVGRHGALAAVSIDAPEAIAPLERQRVCETERALQSYQSPCSCEGPG